MASRIPSLFSSAINVQQASCQVTGRYARLKVELTEKDSELSPIVGVDNFSLIYHGREKGGLTARYERNGFTISNRLEPSKIEPLIEGMRKRLSDKKVTAKVLSLLTNVPKATPAEVLQRIHKAIVEFPNIELNPQNPTMYTSLPEALGFFTNLNTLSPISEELACYSRSEMFREPELIHDLAGYLVEKFPKHSSEKPIIINNSASSIGLEAYSLLMELVEQSEGNLESLHNFRIEASDLNERAIKVAHEYLIDDINIQEIKDKGHNWQQFFEKVPQSSLPNRSKMIEDLQHCLKGGHRSGTLSDRPAEEVTLYRLKKEYRRFISFKKANVLDESEKKESAPSVWMFRNAMYHLTAEEKEILVKNLSKNLPIGSIFVTGYFDETYGEGDLFLQNGFEKLTSKSSFLSEHVYVKTSEPIDALSEVTYTSLSLEQYSGQLYLYTAPAATGKSTIITQFLESQPDKDSVVVVPLLKSREFRPNETNTGEAYHINSDAFQQAQQNGELFQSWHYDGGIYGTFKAPIIEALEQGKKVLLESVPEVMFNLNADYPDKVTTIAIVPQEPRTDTIVTRLISRGFHTAESLGNRLIYAMKLFAQLPLFDMVIENKPGHVEQAVQEIQNKIIQQDAGHPSNNES